MVKRLDMKIALSGREIAMPKLPPGFSFVSWEGTNTAELARAMLECYKGHGDLEFLPERRTAEGCASVIEKDKRENEFMPLFAVKQGQKLCGFTWGEKKNGKYYVSEVGAVPEFQGRGLGRALVLKLLGHFKSIGATESYLGVSESNLPAAPLYKSIGFETIREWDTKDLKKRK